MTRSRTARTFRMLTTADLHERLGKLASAGGRFAVDNHEYNSADDSPLRDLAIEGYVRRINAPAVDRPDLHAQWLADEADFDGFHRRNRNAPR